MLSFNSIIVLEEYSNVELIVLNLICVLGEGREGAVNLLNLFSIALADLAMAFS
ncbi:Uncharacterised protein [Streptococcus pneumoniae]|nr:Uncharacterised protein [Streptococcus pneumoniae]